jgi:molybdopterin converting factor small subunit
MPEPVHVRLPLLLNTMFPTAERVLDLQVRTVDELFDALDERWPGMRDCLADSSPAVRRHINVFVRGRRVKLNAELPPGSDVYILTAISGG